MDRVELGKKFHLANIAYRIKNADIEQRLRDQGLIDIKLEAIAEGKYAENGMNAAIYSGEANGERKYIVGAAGTQPASVTSVKDNIAFAKDLDDDLSVAFNKVPEQAADLKAFVEDFKASRGIDKPLEGVAHSLSCVSMAVTFAENPNLFSNVVLVDGPGVQTFVESVQTDSAMRESLYKKMDIYNGPPNLFNTHGKHPASANIFSVTVPESNVDIKDGSFGLGEQWSLTMSVHELVRLTVGVENGQVQRVDNSWYEGKLIDHYDTKIDQSDYSKVFLVHKNTGQKVSSGESQFQKVKDSYVYRSDNPGITEAEVKEMLGGNAEVIAEEMDLINPTGPRSFTVYKEREVIKDSEESAFSSTFDKFSCAVGDFIDSVGEGFSSAHRFISGDESDPTYILSGGEPIKTSFGAFEFVNGFINNKEYSPYDFYFSILSPHQMWRSNIQNMDGEKDFSSFDGFSNGDFSSDFGLNLAQGFWNFPTASDNFSGSNKKGNGFRQAPFNDFFSHYRENYNSFNGFTGNNYANDPFNNGFPKQPAPPSPAPAPRRGGSTVMVGIGGGVYANHNGAGGFVKTEWKFPIAIDLKNDGVEFIELKDSGLFFDIDDDGYKENTAWVGPKDALLVIDLDRDNKITQGKEIAFTAHSKKGAESDMLAIKEVFDSNSNNKLDRGDDHWYDFKVWQDANTNGRVDHGELKSLYSVGISEISLELQQQETSSDDYSVKVINLADISWMNNNKGKVYDVAFPYSIAGIKYQASDGEILLNYEDERVSKVYVHNSDSNLEITASEEDMIIGGDGNDIISAKSNIVIDAGSGNDTLTGSAGDDWLKGGKGSDKLYGGDGHDILFVDHEDQPMNIDAGNGVDVLIVSTKNGVNLDLTKANVEIAIGNNGNDKFTALGGRSVQIDAGGGDDIIIGSDASDILIGGDGKDSISAGKGDDTLYIDAEDDSSKIDCGEGQDTIVVSSTSGVEINASELNVERIWGSKGDDHFFVDTARENDSVTPVIFYGDSGNDILEGGPRDDILDGGEGNDILRGQGGNDKYVYHSGYGKDVIEHLGEEKFRTTIEFERAFSLLPREKSVPIGRDDSFVLLGGSIQLTEMNFVKEDNDLMLTFYDNQSDELRLKDYFKGHPVKGFVLDYDKGDSVQKIVSVTNEAASEKGIKLSGDNPGIICTLQQNDRIGGSDYNDMINSGGGDDEVIGYSGDDIIIGGKGNDILRGWQGNDVYIFRSGDGHDTIIDELYTYQGQNKKELDAGKDTLRLIGGITLEDLTFSKAEQDLQIKIGNAESQDSITIQKFFNDFNKIEFLEVEGVVHNFDEVI